MRTHALPRGQKGNLCNKTRAYKMRAHALPRDKNSVLCNSWQRGIKVISSIPKFYYCTKETKIHLKF